MNHKRIWLAAAACLTAVLATAQAKAIMIAPPPAATRIANADLVVVGKVTKFGPKLVKGEMFKGDERDMQIATIKVSDTLLGKEVKEIEVGFFPPASNNGGGGPRIRPRPGVQLKQDQEACLILTKHPTKKGVYVVTNFYDSIPKESADFAKQLETILKSAKLLAKPTDGLKSKEAEDRLLTAALLITRYRTDRTAEGKTEKVAVDESKLILQALAEADWAPKNNPRVGGNQISPQNLFFNLGVTEKDGWKMPKDFTKLADEAKKWCKDNAGKYQIVRFTSEAKKEEKK